MKCTGVVGGPYKCVSGKGARGIAERDPPVFALLDYHRELQAGLLFRAAPANNVREGALRHSRPGSRS